jgi:hypothetical protein
MTRNVSFGRRSQVFQKVLRFLVVFGGMVLLSITSIPVTHAQDRAKAVVMLPLYGCKGITCDGKPPPPLTDCGGSQGQTIDNQKTIYEDGDINKPTAVLDLFFSPYAFCYSFWGGLNVTGSGHTIQIKHMYLVVADLLGNIYEYTLDTLPINRSSGQWESTYMYGTVSAGCYHVYSDVIDDLSTGHESKTNTITWCVN